MKPVPFLRDAPGDPLLLGPRYAMACERLSLTDAHERLSLLAELGTMARSLRNFPAAIEHFSEAHELAQQLGDKSRAAANLVRLGVALHHSDDPGVLARAEQCFRQVIASDDPACADYRDFAWQHLGKLLVEQENFRAARQCFEQALSLRLIKQNSELIASTQQALDALAGLSGYNEDTL